MRTIKHPNKRILIMCEGLTEYYYAKSLQQEMPKSIQRGVLIEVQHDSRNDPVNLVLAAQKRKKIARFERNHFDTVWIFFDNDNRPLLQLEEAFRLIRKEGFRYAYSSICLEHWFILHFCNCGKSFQKPEEALSFLTKKWPHYDKTKVNLYFTLRDKLEFAIENSLLIKKISDETIPIHKKNPYFTIPDLISFFRDLSTT